MVIRGVVAVDRTYVVEEIIVLFHSDDKNLGSRKLKVNLHSFLKDGFKITIVGDGTSNIE